MKALEANRVLNQGHPSLNEPFQGQRSKVWQVVVPQIPHLSVSLSWWQGTSKSRRDTASDAQGSREVAQVGTGSGDSAGTLLGAPCPVKTQHPCSEILYCFSCRQGQEQAAVRGGQRQAGSCGGASGLFTNRKLPEKTISEPV